MNNLLACLRNLPTQEGCCFLQDGDSSQNSIKSRTAWDEVEEGNFAILAGSLDLKPIENPLYFQEEIVSQYL